MANVWRTILRLDPGEVGIGVIVGGVVATYVGELPAMAVALVLVLAARWRCRPAPTLAERHQRHYQTCNCLGDSSECCVPSCACHGSNGSDAKDGG